MESEPSMDQEPIDPLSRVILDLVKSNQRQLAWSLIDHYLSKAETLEHFDILGYLSLKTDKRDTYLRCAETVVGMAATPQQLFAARCNLIKAYNIMNRPEDALFYIDMNLRLDPENFELQCDRAGNLALQGDRATAEKILTELQTKYPEKQHKLQSGFAGKYLREGQLAKGITCFVEAIKSVNKKFDHRLGMQQWQGIIVPGRKIYVDIEGGIGDQVINMRFFDHLTQLGMTPILASVDHDFYRDINQVFRRHGHQVITDTVSIDRTQKWVPMLSLPARLGLTESDLWCGPYLTPLRQEKNKLSGSALRIGIKCAGNPYFVQDEYRKIPLQAMLDILPKNAEIYYIDKETITTSDTRVTCLADRINSWEDTMDFIDQMHCVVSSCTSLVHFAAAMGKTTFVAVPIAEYYIWTSTRTDHSTPWYGRHVYVARQTKVRDWTEPLQELGQMIDNFLGSNLG